MNEIKLLIRLARRVEDPKDVIFLMGAGIIGAIILYLIPDDIFE